MGQETYIANLINNATQPVIDFGGQTYRIDAAIELNTTNTVWREIRNLVIEAEGAGSYVALDIPRWSEAIHKRKFSNIKITKTGTTGVGTGIEVRPTSVVLTNVFISNFEKGMVLKGLNLAMIRESVFDSNAVGVEVDRDTDFGGNGYRGNDTHFIGCRFRQNTTSGVYFLANAIETGGTAANFNTFSRCNFEYSGLTDTDDTTRYLCRVINGSYHVFDKCRFEMEGKINSATNNKTGTYRALSLEESSGTLQYTRVTDCIFSVHADASTGDTSNIYGISIGSGCSDTYLTRNEFDSANDGSGGTETNTKISDSGTNTYGTDNTSVANSKNDCAFLYKASPGTVATQTLTGSYVAVQPACTLSSLTSAVFTETNEAGAAADSHLSYGGNIRGNFLMTLNIAAKFTNITNTPTITIRLEYYNDDGSPAWDSYGASTTWSKPVSTSDNSVCQDITMSAVIYVGEVNTVSGLAKYMRIAAARSSDTCDLNIYGFQWTLTRIS